MRGWSVYLVRTADGSLYTGIAADVDRRFAEHDRGTGAKFLRGRGPLGLVFRSQVGDRGVALRAEHRLKRWAKYRKEALVRDQPDTHELLERLGLGAEGKS
jgi:putative endonuclease